MFPKDSVFLVVEDSRPTLQEVKDELNKLGYEKVVLAHDGVDGYEKLLQYAKSGVQIDVVIADWKMPRLSGLDLLKRIRANPEITTIPVILLTSVAEADFVMQAIAAGTSHYVLKPVKGDVIKKKLEELWEKQKKVATRSGSDF